MRIFISGINGFLGSSLKKNLEGFGHVVLGSIRNKTNTSQYKTCENSISIIEIGKSFDESCLKNIDLLIHAFHDFSKNSFNRNIDTTLKIFKIAKAFGTKKQIFISSYSSHPNATNEYGKIKWHLEQIFQKENQIVLKPGLVIGNGGMFLRMLKNIKRSPVIPLLDGGLTEVPVLSLNDFLKSVNKIIDNDLSGCFNLHDNNIISMKEFIVTIKKVLKQKKVIVPIPFCFAYYFLLFIDKIGIPFPISVSSLIAYRENQIIHNISDLEGLIGSSEKLMDIISATVRTLK